MKSPNLVRNLFSCVMASVLLGAGTPAAAASPTVLSLRLLPEEVVLPNTGASQRFLVLGRGADGLERDVTSQSRFSLASSGVAQVDPAGRVTSLAAGETTLQVRRGELTARASIRVSKDGAQRPFSFSRDIGTILTKRGCNSSDCHGGVKGRAGFKLSIDALHPRDDYRWIVQGGDYQVMSAEAGGAIEPRVDLGAPDRSLLLQKPTLQIPHGGGERISPDSPDYRVLLDWVRQGARYGDETAETARKIRRLEVLPSEVVLESGARHGLVVRAHLSDGSHEDVTGQVRYESSNLETVKVDSEGTVRALNPGETSVLVRAPGHVVSTRIGVIADAVTDSVSYASRNYIDEYVLAKLRKFHLRPARRSTDAEFLRRICLDLTGTLPPPHRVREFLASRDPDKREQLVDLLLESLEFTDYWTFRLADLMRVGHTATGMAEHGHIYWQWVRDSVATNKPYDRMASERITAQGYDGASRHFLQNGVIPRPENAMAEQFRVFLGRRLDCAQCHNHPYESWSQDEFWGLAAFFKRVTRSEWSGFGTSLIYDDPEGPDPDFGTDPNSKKTIHPRTGREVEPVLPDGSPVPAHAHSSPRQTFARWVTNHPWFAEAAVNRFWGTIFGRGLVEPVDDFRSTNPPTHPRLLKTLARDFREQGYDLKQLLRRMVLSETYQLSSLPRPGSEADRINYSHSLPRPLDAEVLLDAVTSVTAVAQTFENTDKGMAPPGTRAIELTMPDIFPSAFLDMYGRTDRAQIPERSAEPSLNQALHLLVGSTYTEKLAREGSRLERLMATGATDAEIIEELYLAALTRYPRQEERDGLEQLIQRSPSRGEGLKNLVWALLASREFAHNH